MDNFTLFVHCNFLVLLSTTVCSQNINKQIVNIADENLTDYSFISRDHYTKPRNYLKRRYRIRHWIPMFIGTPCMWEGLQECKKYLFCYKFRFQEFWDKFCLLKTRENYVQFVKSVRWTFSTKSWKTLFYLNKKLVEHNRNYASKYKWCSLCSTCIK